MITATPTTTMGTRTEARLRREAPMPEAVMPPHSLLQLIWLASPALPVGGFSYSEGLEAAIEWAGVQDEATASDWLVGQLHLSLAPGDLAVVAEANRAWRAMDMPRVRALNAWVLTTRESAEFLLQTEQMGRSLTEWLRNRYAGEAAHHTSIQWLAQQDASYPIAFSFAAHCTGAAARDALLAYAFGWAENMVQAAIKAVPLGQSAGQRILARLAGDIPAAVNAAMLLPDNERVAFSPMLAILSARHEHQYSRIFRS